MYPGVDFVLLLVYHTAIKKYNDTGILGFEDII